MAARILISDNFIRVSKPGFDVNTAGLNKMLLALDMRVGQVIATGYQAAVTVQGSIKKCTINYGPFASKPDIYMFPKYGNEHAWACPGNFRVNTQGEGTFYNMFFTEEISQTGSQLIVTAYPELIIAGDDATSERVLRGISYVIYRKPFEG